MNILRTISYILVIVGALNWGVLAISGIDLVATLFGNMTLISRFVYFLVGISALISIFTSYHRIFED